ncbi:MAG: DUF2058 domain-containing protein [Gammaproteobacteria bacterium]
MFDQLKKSGLVDEKKAKQAKKEKQKQARQQKGKKAKLLAESKLLAQQAQAEKVARDRELNQQRKLAAEQVALAAQIKQLIQMNSIQDTQGDIGFNFTDGNKVQRLYVTDALHAQLVRGRLAVVKLEQDYALVPAGVAEKIKLRDPSCVLVCNEAGSEGTDEDDPYADFQVPDDLMW